MYLNKLDREELESLSKKVFGAKHKYLKILKRGAQVRSVEPGVNSHAKPLKTTLIKYFTLEELCSFMEEEAAKMDRAAVTKVI
jgi:hypothetical protein